MCCPPSRCCCKCLDSPTPLSSLVFLPMCQCGCASASYPFTTCHCSVLKCPAPVAMLASVPNQAAVSLRCNGVPSFLSSVLSLYSQLCTSLKLKGSVARINSQHVACSLNLSETMQPSRTSNKGPEEPVLPRERELPRPRSPPRSTSPAFSGVHPCPRAIMRPEAQPSPRPPANPDPPPRTRRPRWWWRTSPPRRQHSGPWPPWFSRRRWRQRPWSPRNPRSGRRL